MRRRNGWILAGLLAASAGGGALGPGVVVRQAAASPLVLDVEALAEEEPVRLAPTSEATLAALHRCFEHQVRHHHRSSAPQGAIAVAGAAPAEPVRELAPLGPAAELFFFDQLESSERELGGGARLMWCRPWFSGPYNRAHAVLSRRSRVPRPVPHPDAPAKKFHHFSHHNDATRVLRAAAHAGGHHPTAQRSRAAVEALAEHGGGPTPLDADWLAATAMLPDLYLFAAPHAHALTPDTGAPPDAPQIERARRQFVAHVRGAVAEAQRAELQGDHALALVQLGVAAHALHDLALHRGMTEAEHAALTYVRHQGPDLVATAAQEALAGQALASLFARVWPEGARTRVGWREGEPALPRSRELTRLMMQAYRHAHEVDYAALLRRYQDGRALVEAGRAAPGPHGLDGAVAGRWDVASTLVAIWREDGALD